jgi:hypothetical protein
VLQYSPSTRFIPVGQGELASTPVTAGTVGAAFASEPEAAAVVEAWPRGWVLGETVPALECPSPLEIPWPSLEALGLAGDAEGPVSSAALGCDAVHAVTNAQPTAATRNAIRGASILQSHESIDVGIAKPGAGGNAPEPCGFALAFSRQGLVVFGLGRR